MQKGLDRQLVLYRYQAHGRIVASEYWGKIYTVVDAIRLNRSDGAMVRVIVPIPSMNEGAEREAERLALEFAGHVPARFCRVTWTASEKEGHRETRRTIRTKHSRCSRSCSVAPACSRDPDAAKREHLARADQYVKENKLAEAVIEYRNAINLDARYGEARYKLADVYERQDDAQNAFNEFVRAADLLPDRDDVQVKAAKYLLLARRYDDAKRLAGALVKKNPRNIDAQIVLANSMANLKDLPSAIKELESAVQNDPSRVDTYLGLAAYQSSTRTPTRRSACFGTPSPSTRVPLMPGLR